MVKVKGVEDTFDSLTHIREILEGDGTYELHAADMNYGIPGLGVAYLLGMGYTYDKPLKIYAPKREGQLDMANPMEGFVEDELYSPGVVFAMKQGKYDKNYILTSVAFTRKLFAQDGMLSSLELRLKAGSDLEAVKKRMRSIANGKYKVLDRFEQQADTFKIMQIEKFIAYIFLTFILIVACFNIIGSLSMLIIDKREDVVTLRNLGANDRQISSIFLFEGRLIVAIGAIVGVALGLLLCWLQQRFGLVGMGGSSGMFVVNAYPVSVHYQDVLLVFFTVLVVGSVAVWYPVQHFSRRLLNTDKADTQQGDM
jgi:lipoprotein-releasing system permease protein